MRVLVTGGAGFIGSNVAVALAARRSRDEIVALDNLRRRGSQLNLPRLAAAGVRFVHGDVRQVDDLAAVGEVHALVECSAEPSVLAGVDGDPGYAVGTNLLGAFHCLEVVRRWDAQLIFLSTSRVYPVGALRELALRESATRFELAEGQTLTGASPAGISEAFPLLGPRTLYGSTKLAAEMLIEEYVAGYGSRAVVNRCGVVAGPWQLGRVDQGVFTHWLLAHHFGRPLRYIGFGGSGKQVRDLLHVLDLADLIADQLDRPDHWQGFTGNVGGGPEVSLSLCETTALCAELTGRRLEVEASAEERPGDVPLYVSDCRRLFARTDWRPSRGPREILSDTAAWIAEHERELAQAL